MSFVLKTTKNVDDIAEFITSSILKQLKLDKHVLFFIAGGSAISVSIRVSELLKNELNKNLIQNLTITLTDERYGPIDHFNSNFFQLIEKGFNIREAKIIPVLIDNDRNITTEKFNKILNDEFMIADYTIGLFGIGADGHTAGILPESPALNSKDLAFSYDTPVFSRITMTPKAIEKLNEAVVWAQGENKWSVIKDLEKEIDINKQPAQILKKVPLLTIFSDYKKI